MGTYKVRSLAALLCVALSIAVFSALSADAGPSRGGDAKNADSEPHRLILPQFNPTASGCEQEAADYAAALIALAVAQDNADDAYYAWAACSSGSQNTKSPGEQLREAPVTSVLVND